MLALAGACSDDDPPAPEHVCAGASALDATTALRGGSLPPKTLALTFDDGPGARTLELSAWLRDQGIHAAFFVNGKNCWNAAVLPQLIADGHVVANHTQNHKSLTGRSTTGVRPSDWTIVDEVTETDTLIAPFVTNDRFMFRPPYGDFDGQTQTTLASTPMSKYVGPILWDIGDHMGPHQAVDWDCWQPGNDGKVYTVQQCGDLYHDEIRAVGKGIVLMHDLYFIDNDPTHGGTVDMVKYLVPQLRDEGYSFVRVDEVPEIAALLPPLPAPPPPSEADASAPTPASTNATPPATPASSSTSAPPTLAAPVSSASGTKPSPCLPSPHGSTTKTSPSAAK